MSNATPLVIAVLAGRTRAPAVAFGCAAERVAQAVARWPLAVRVTLPAVLVVPYVSHRGRAAHVSLAVVCLIRRDCRW
jgi:hypothetical protein